MKEQRKIQKSTFWTLALCQEQKNEKTTTKQMKTTKNRKQHQKEAWLCGNEFASHLQYSEFIPTLRYLGKMSSTIALGRTKTRGSIW